MAKPASKLQAVVLRISILAKVFVLLYLQSIPQLQAATTKELKIGLSNPITSVDPMFHNTLGNENLARHIFETLLVFDSNFELKPQLAVAWKLTSDLVWEFKLRRDVKFHDGSNFTAADVKFSIERARNLRGSPSSYAYYTRPIEKMVIIDDHTIELHTKTPYPLLPDDLTYLFIQSKEATQGLSTKDLNRGQGLAGTGPYIFREWEPGRYVHLDVNTHYWGNLPEWQSVAIVQVPSPASRVVGILSGKLDLIDGVPPPDMDRLRQRIDVTLFTSVTNRLMYLQLDHRPIAPFVQDRDGNPLAENALLDHRVRKAISLAIDRDLIIKKILAGRGLSANQYHPPIMRGSLPNLPVLKPDLKQAQHLLKETGLANKVALTLHTSNDRYLYADKVAIAIGQSLSRIGIQSTIRVQPHLIFRTRGSKGELSVQLGSWQAENTSTFLASNLVTIDKAAGLGYRNRGFYSSEQLDQIYKRAMSQHDTQTRLQLLQQAALLAIEDYAVIPLYFVVDAWAVRTGLCYEANPRQMTLAVNVNSQCAKR